MTSTSVPASIASAILYATPATAVLGAILVTGFLGGAICAQVRIGEFGTPPELISLILGAVEPARRDLGPARSGQVLGFPLANGARLVFSSHELLGRNVQTA